MTARRPAAITPAYLWNCVQAGKSDSEIALGRPLRIVRCYGADDAAPVVLEELAAVGDAAAGQYALWSADGVRRAMQVPLGPWEDWQ